MFRVPSETPSPPANGPSTTPAGPPPEDKVASSTPAGPPPSRLFGPFNPHPQLAPPQRNQALPAMGDFGDFGQSIMHSSPPKNRNDHSYSGYGTGLFGTPTTARPGSGRGRNSGTFKFPSSPPDHGRQEDEEEEEDEMDQDAEGEEDDQMYEDERNARGGLQYSMRRSRANNALYQSTMSRSSAADELLEPPIVRMDVKQSGHDLLRLAKGLAPNFEHKSLREPDDIILETERLLEKLHESISSGTPEQRSAVLDEVAQDLMALWQAYSGNLRESVSVSGGLRDSSSHKNATKLASLLLSIHHPSQTIREERPFALSLVRARPDSRQYRPIPRVLLDWMSKYVGPPVEVAMVKSERHGFSAHQSFWEAIHVSVIRGKFSDALDLLRGANFEVAETAEADGLGDGYTGYHLESTNDVIQEAIQLIEKCPAVSSEDWDIKDHDWSNFRQNVHFAWDDLREYAEGDSHTSHGVSQGLQASHFGMSRAQNSFNLSTASRQAESHVPWSIYQNLIRLYKLLLGSEDEIVTMSADWVEAVVGLTVWWNGDEEVAGQGSLAASRRSLARTHRVRTVDVTPVKAYCQRLSASLAAVFENDDEDLCLNTSDRSEVGLACIFDDNVEGALQILRSWSLPIASAVSEVASGGDWFRRADGILDQFDQSDLMVLSYNEDQRPGISKDDLLTAYADQLAAQGEFSSQDFKTVREGWELAIHVLDRLDDHHTANTSIEKILNGLKLESPERVNKITQLCYSMGLFQHAQSIALNYANYLRENTQNYGDTLLYYARSHEASKVQEVLRVLVAHCLVNSMAYPPRDELDETLHSLITTPKQTLTKLASLDPEGAQLLSNYLSGYATIRKFYDLRDEELFVAEGEKPAHRPMARKREAANALMVIISSAASSIRGGLYDPEVETVVQVDVLLSLLGEALIFVNNGKRTLTLQHLLSLLSAVEDLVTAPGMIRAQCDEVLSATLAASYEGRTQQSRSTMHKSTSNLTTASSQYSLINSAEFGSVQDRSTESSAVLVKGSNVADAKRAWDWRKGFNQNASGNDVIRILRLGIARETAKAFASGEVPN